MDGRLYCAVIGDIDKSRELPRRAGVQLRFEKAIARINDEFSRAIASGFVLTLGDEFQGLLTSAGVSLPLIRRFRDLMGPIPFTFGVGVGRLSTQLKEKVALGMDGEAFHRARAALLAAKKQERGVRFDFSDPALPLANALVGLVEKQWSRLTPRQREIAALLRTHEKQRVVARKLGISQPAVSKSASSAVVSQLREAEGALEMFLDTLIPS
jgi:hypothetical protein